LLALECGEISEREFENHLRAGLERDGTTELEVERFWPVFLAAFVPNPPMIDFVRELRGNGLRTAMITNSVREWEHLWYEVIAVDEIFDVFAGSATIGVRKPEAGIYEWTLSALGVAPGECVNVDDTQVNCEGAQDAGLVAIRFEDTEQAIADVRATLARE
jgi:epoxide hydrolase-like predicted phosphatase